MKTQKKYALVLLSLATSATILALTSLKVFADDPAPVLKIQQIAPTEFSITITNSVSTNYTLYWTPALADANYPWIVLTNASPGESNFVVDVGGWNIGFFRVMLGNDGDGDGVVEWLDAQPGNSSVGILSITIDNPLNGATFN